MSRLVARHDTKKMRDTVSAGETRIRSHGPTGWMFYEVWKIVGLIMVSANEFVSHWCDITRFCRLLWVDWGSIWNKSAFIHSWSISQLSWTFLGLQLPLIYIHTVFPASLDCRKSQLSSDDCATLPININGFSTNISAEESCSAAGLSSDCSYRAKSSSYNLCLTRLAPPQFKLLNIIRISQFEG